jgi:beta-galactosidase
MNATLDELFSRLWHGADYNYEQWLGVPGVHAEDFRLMNAAGCTAMSVGIFSWVMLEPEDGRYEFGWLDDLMDSLHAHGIRAILATPSAAHPAWLSRQYPAVLRTQRDGRRVPHRHRVNFCRTSPDFRRKVREINTRLAKRYAGHPALLLWHVSNEYNGEPCYCAGCLAGFRGWLEARYGTLDALNAAYWAAFWSHRYSGWEEIEPVDESMHGLMLDWKRYNSDQVIDFYLAEIEPLRRFTPRVPVTTNFMRPFVGLDYWKFARHVDVVSWDSYPEWHVHDDAATAAEIGFFHDLHRGYKRQPFYLIESSPSVTNWQPLSRLKRPGLLKLASAQAIAHGSIGVNYFQWRQGRGGEEKFHGAVVSHWEAGRGRVFAEVSAVGELLAALPELAAASNPAEVAILLDIENMWALDLAQLPRNADHQYVPELIRHYRNFWEAGIPVDVAAPGAPLDPYKLVIAPMLYLLEESAAARLAACVEAGGTLVTTWLTGLVDASDLVHRGGCPAPLAAALGIARREMDTFGAAQSAALAPVPGNPLGLDETGRAEHYAELVSLTTAQPLAVYASEFYAGSPALTVNTHGRGTAYHLAARPDDAFLRHFYARLAGRLGIQPLLPAAPPAGVSVQMRTTDRQRYLFLMNFTPARQTVQLAERALTLDPYGLEIIVQPKETAS